MIADTNDVCICYDLYILFEANMLLTRVYLKFISTIKTAVIVKDNLDYYKYTDNNSYFCKSCYSIIFETKILKFGSTNYINFSSYQKYSNVFSNLTFVKKVFIACVYPVMSIIQLRPNSFGTSVLYN